MEKQIAQGSYWLGLVSSLLAVAWKGLASVRFLPEEFGKFQYMTLYKGGLLFLVVATASAALAMAKTQKD